MWWRNRRQEDTPRQTGQATHMAGPGVLAVRFLLLVLGSATYVLISAGAFTAVRLYAASHLAPVTSAGWLFVSLAHGIALAIVILLVRAAPHGHVNPATTFASTLLGSGSWRELPRDLLAQFLGGVVGAVGVLVLYGRPGVTTGQLGTVTRAPGVSLWQAFVIEGLGTGVLMLTSMAGSQPPRVSSEWSWLSLGMVVVVMTMVLGPATGATLNPARAFGPDLLGAWFGLRVNWTEYLIVYLAGPVVACVLAGWGYQRLIRGLPASLTNAETQRGQS